jgi:fructosamine-3-kinase
VHGDLWSGNFLCDAQSRPVLIDPAVYYGHRAVDIGMTHLFGGFDKRFYEAYQYHAALSNKHEEQWEVCNLYPLMIHLLLFGKSYLAAIEGIMKKYR